MPVPTTLGRLRSSGDIAAVLRGPRQRAGRVAVLHVAQDRPDGHPRLAVVASRRVGGSVSRNRAKRLLRESARRLPWRPGTDVVLVARASCATSPLGTVHDEVARLATELDVLEGGS